MHKSSQSHEYFHISFFLQTPAFPAISLGPNGSKRVFATLTLHESSQATCQCSPACRRLTIGVSVVVKLLAFSLGLQRQNHFFFCPKELTSYHHSRSTTPKLRHDWIFKGALPSLHESNTCKDKVVEEPTEKELFADTSTTSAHLSCSLMW